MRRRDFVVAVPLATWAVACSQDDATDTSTSASSTTVTPTVTAAADPQPAAAVASTDSAFAWQASFRVTLAESAGASATVRTLTADLEQAAGGIVITPPTGLDESFRFVVRADAGNRVAASGSLPIEFDFFYSLPNLGREALVTIVLTLVDDESSTSTVTVSARVV
ncbi:MAG: hypothetical protein NDJ94_07070 [Vicinamibacteria bacterium]|jgi:hypothetical protein|nr:hypothetical protein [Vicinamibacteria bacterium]